MIAGAAALLGWELLRGDDRSRELGPLAWPLGLLVAWSGLTPRLDEGPARGRRRAALLLAPVRPARRLAVAARLEPPLAVVHLPQLVGWRSRSRAIGVYQYATRDVFWNPKVIVGNAYAPFYRVNSVFYDPSVYGRFLVVAILAALVMALYDRNRRVAYGSARRDRADLAGPALLVLAVELRGADASGRPSSPRSAGAGGRRSRSASCRADRRRRARHAAHPPLAAAGVGLGPEQGLVGPREARHAGDQDRRAPPDPGRRDRRLQARVRRPRRPAAARSRRRRRRTTPRSRSRPRRAFRGCCSSAGWWRRRSGRRRSAAPASAFKGRCLSRDRRRRRRRSRVHSLFYNALFEDPMFWGLLGLTALCARLPLRRGSRRRRSRGSRPSRPKVTA